jgi:threonine dehydrogenase-like Zn-dependent dehydrogenase
MLQRTSKLFGPAALARLAAGRLRPLARGRRLAISGFPRRTVGARLPRMQRMRPHVPAQSSYPVANASLEHKNMNVTIVGTGYVGLVTGACLAELGNNVFCLDVDRNKIDLLNAGGVPIHEPGLEEVLLRNVEEGRLTFSCDAAASVAFADLQFIAVGTPPDEDGSADLRYVLAAARAIGRHMDGFKVIVDKSTVPVGTAQQVAAAVGE